MSLHSQIRARVHDRWLRETQSSQRLGEGSPTVSQPAHRELAPTYPHQVCRLVCSHLRNVASAQAASLTFDLTSSTSTTFQASRAPVAIARETEYSGRHTQKGRRGMRSGTLDPGGEVHIYCVG